MIWLSEDLPGTGGTYKETAEDFQVEEVPLYPCCGEGEHLYLWVEKINTSTRELIHQLTRGLQIKEHDIGYAGLKDSRALTRQMISVPFNKVDQAKNLDIKDCKILKMERHTNKLRLGHLAGNRFTITLRGTCAEATAKAEAILERLLAVGVPNRFGEQRYGVLGNSARLGELLLQRRYEEFCRELIGDPQQIRNPAWKHAALLYRQGDPAGACQSLPGRMRDERRLLKTLVQSSSFPKAVKSLSRNLARLYLSACQSELFDRLLDRRLPAINTLEDGDIAIKHVNGACFRVEQAALEQGRADTFEISPTAPLFGTKVMLAEGRPGQAEQALLDQRELRPESWKTDLGIKMPGERRALRVPLTAPRVISADTERLTLGFTLPKGSYATSVLKEIVKQPNNSNNQIDKSRNKAN